MKGKTNRPKIHSIHSVSAKYFPLSISIVVLIAIATLFSSTYHPSMHYDWDDIRPEIRDSAIAIVNYNKITSFLISINAHTPRQWHSRRWFMKNANKEELAMLLDHPNAALKTTAYEGLLRKSKSNNYDLMHQALNDTTSSFMYFSGCIGYPMMVGEYLSEHVIPLAYLGTPLSEHQKKAYRMTESEIHQLRKLYKKRKKNKGKYLSL